MLLEYFGEQTAKDCGQCDVCLSKTADKQKQHAVREEILSLLADRQRHHITEVLRLPLSMDELDAALASLVADEHVKQTDGWLQKV